MEEYPESVFPVFLHCKNDATQKNQQMPASVVVIVISIAIRLLKQTYFPITHVQCTCFLHNLTKGPVLSKHSLKWHYTCITYKIARMPSAETKFS